MSGATSRSWTAQGWKRRRASVIGWSRPSSRGCWARLWQHHVSGAEGARGHRAFLRELCKTYHVAIRVTNFEIALAPFGILWDARVQSLRPEVLVQSIYASDSEDHTRPAVARALRSMAQVDDTPSRAHGREGGIGSAIRHMETQPFIEHDGLGHIAHRKGYGADVVNRPV